MCPNSLKPPLYKGDSRGLCLPKTVPQPRPNSAPTQIRQQLLRIRERSFAYTRTVVWANANGCRKGSEPLSQRHSYLVRKGSVPYKVLLEAADARLQPAV